MGRGPVGAPAIIRYVNNSLASVTDVSGIDDSMVLIKTLTASSSGTISFVHGTSDVTLDSTYPIYLFKFYNVHPQTDDKDLTFQGSINAGSSYGVTITSTYFASGGAESGTDGWLNYSGSIGSGYPDWHLNQETSFQTIVDRIGSNADQSASGELWLYNPSSTTYVKHFMSRATCYYSYDYAFDVYAAGYFNDTNDVDAIQFKMNSGNIDAGTFKLYGIKDS